MVRQSTTSKRRRLQEKDRCIKKAKVIDEHCNVRRNVSASGHFTRITRDCPVQLQESDILGEPEEPPTGLQAEDEIASEDESSTTTEGRAKDLAQVRSE